MCMDVCIAGPKAEDAVTSSDTIDVDTATNLIFFVVLRFSFLWCVFVGGFVVVLINIYWSILYKVNIRQVDNVAGQSSVKRQASSDKRLAECFAFRFFLVL